MKIRKIISGRLARFPLAALFVAGVAQAAQVTWDSTTGVAGVQDGAGTWNTVNPNWWNGASNALWPNTFNDEAIVGAGNGAAGFLTVSGTVNLNKLTFNSPSSGNYVLTGGTLNFGGTTPTIHTTPLSYIQSTISGSGGLTKTGGERLVLYGVNTYTGATTISAGSLYLGAFGTTGTLNPASPIINNSVLTFFRTNTITQGIDFGVISGSGVVNQGEGPGAYGTTILSLANTYTGGTFIKGGTIKLGSGTGIPAGGNVTVAAGASFDTVGSFSNSSGAAIGTVTLNGGSMINSGGGPIDYYLNRLVMTGGTVSQVGSGDFWYHLVNAGAGITVNSSATTSQLLGDSGGNRIRNDTGAFVPITVASGAASGIDLDVSTLLGPGDFTKVGPGTMRLSNTGNTANFLVSAGRLRVDAIINGTNGPFGSGTISINGGIVSYGAASSISTTKGFTLGATAGGGIEVSEAAATLTVTGAVTGTGGVLNKTGPGTLALTSASHTGATTISAGKLMLSNVGNGFASGVSVPTGSVFELNNTGDLNTFDVMQLNGSPITGTGTITKTGPGVVQYQNTTVLADFAGTVDIQAGTFGSSQTSGTIGKADSLMTVNVGPSGLFDMRISGVNGARIDKLTGTGRVGNTWPGSGVLTVGTGNGSSTFAGQIQGNSTNGSVSETTNPNTGTVALVKTGTGTLTLSGTNSYSGLTSVNQGILWVYSNSALGSANGTAATGTVVEAGGQLRLGGGVTIGANETLNLAGTGPTGLGSGALNIKFVDATYLGPISLADDATIAGSIGILNLGGPVSISNKQLNIGGDDFTVNFNGAITGSTGGSIDTLLCNSQTTNLNAANTYRGRTTINNLSTILNANVANALPTLNGRSELSMYIGALNIAGANQAVASISGIISDPFTPQVTLGARTLTIGYGSGVNMIGNPTANFPGVISGTGGIIKDQGSTQILSGSNTYSGLTTISGGVLQIGSNESSPSLGNSSFSVASGAQLVFSRNTDSTDFSNQSISGSGDVVFTGQSTGYFRLSDSYAGTLTHSGKTTVNFFASVGGTASDQRSLWLEKDNVFSNASILDLQSGKVFLRNQTGQGLKTAGLTGVAGTLLTTDQGLVQKVTINAAGGSLSFAGLIGRDAGFVSSTDNISLTKTGAGTQTLTGANTYTGGTTISGGTLIVSETIAAAASATGVGPVTVNGSVTLGGGNAAGTVGSVRGSLTVASGGTVTPGISGPGILTVNGNASFAGGSTLQIQIDGASAGTSHDQLKVNGTVALGGATLVRSGSFVPAAGQSFVLVNNDGSDPVSGTFAGLPQGSPLSINGTVLYISYIGGDGNDVVLHPPVVVNSLADNDPGSLRQLIDAAVPGDVIIFDASLSGKTTNLTSGELLIGKTLAIDATGLASGLTISGGDSSRVFNIESGNTVRLAGLTIIKGRSPGGGPSGEGGGILNSGILIVEQCALTENVSLGNGGAIANFGNLSLINSTIAQNSASLVGGGIFDFFANSTLRSSTITNNMAGTEGGGVLFLTSTATIENTIVAGNLATTDPDLSKKSGGSITPAGNNLIGINTSVSVEFPAGPLHGTAGAPVKPRLAPLSHYGGPTPSMPPLVGSPVIDAVLATSLAIDQRGFSRVVDGAPPAGAKADIGAVEAGPVTLVSDSGDSGIRNAIAAATAPGARILFNLSSTDNEITLSAGQLSPGGSRTIFIDASSLVNGAGEVAEEEDPLRPGTMFTPGGVTVSGGNSSRVFSIPTTSNVAINRMRVTEGNSNSSGASFGSSGGGISNAGTLTLIQVAIDNCATAYRGGGLLNSGTASLIECTVSDNTAPDVGGGIDNEGTDPKLTLTNSTVAGNTSSNRGGGIFNFKTLTLTNSTISNNTATQGGGFRTQNGTVNLENTIIAGNISTSSDPNLSISGANTFNSAGGNFIGNNQGVTSQFLSGTPNANGDYVGTSAAPIDPLLGPLADNGGPTKTMAFVGNSPAIDAGLSTVRTPFTDQRGFARIVVGGLDIGAYESGAANFNQSGLTLYANVPPGQTAASDDVEFEISTDKDFLSTISTLAGTGDVGSTNGPKLSAEFSYPSDVAQDTQGNIFIADTGNNRIRMLTPAGDVSTIAGTGAFGFANGPGLSAAFKFPAGIAIGPDDNLYVSDTLNHRIRKLTKPAAAGLQWTVTTLAGTGSSGFFEGVGSVARFNHPHGLVVDQATGNVFVADAFNHRIRKVTPGGTVSTYAGSGVLGADDATRLDSTFNVPFGVALDSAGNLFVADRDNHLIRKVTTGAVSTFAGSGSAGFDNDDSGDNATFDTPVAIDIDDDDNLFVSDQNNHAVRKIAPDTKVTTVAGKGALAGPGDEDGNSTNARFESPAGLTVDLSGNLVVADTGNHRLRRIVIKPLSVIATKGTGDAFGVPFSAVIDAAELGLDPNVQYYFRWRSALDDSTQMLGQSFSMIPLPVVVTLAADLLTPTTARLNATVNPLDNVASVKFEYSTDPAMLSPEPVELAAGSFGGSLSVPASAVTALPEPETPGSTVYFRAVATNARGTTVGETLSFTHPVPTVVTDAADSLTRTKARLNATVDPKNNPLTVKFIYSTDPNLEGPLKVTTLAGSGVAGFANAAGAGAQFNTPQGVAVIGTNTYVADRLNNLIREVTPAGVVSTYGSFADYDRPAGVAADSGGNLYVADEFNHVIRKIGPGGGPVTAFAGSGVAGDADGAAAAASFLFPAGAAVDGGGNIYVADSGNHCIRKIAASAGSQGGAVTTVAGTGSPGFADGLPGVAQFDSPRAIAVSADGTLYVADTGNHRIRRIATDGTVSTLAGSGADGFLDGTGGAASFSSPTGIAVDGDGVAFVTDQGNHRIRRITSDGQVSTYAGSGVAGLVNSPLTGLYPVTAAQFNLPSGIAVDGSGNLLVTQEGSPALRRIARDALPLEVIVTPDASGPGERLVSLDVEPPFLAGTTYYYRALGTNSLDTIEGEIVSFTLPTEPVIAVSSGAGIAAVSLVHDQTEAVDFGQAPLNVSVAREFTIGNTGGWELSLAPITVPAGYSVTGGTGPVPAGGSVTFEVTLVATSSGVFSGNISIPSGDPGRPVFTFPITGKVLDPPDVTTLEASDVAPTQATLNAEINPLGSSATALFEYSNDPELDGVEVTTLAALEFSNPWELATDSAGNIYVADTGNHRIRKITPGGSVSTFAGTGVAGFANGPGGSAQFSSPRGLAIGSDGVLYVGDTNNHRIRAISLTGVVSTFSGSGDPGFTEGVGGGARFNAPQGLAIDSTDNLYVADFLNDRIRKVAPNGSVSTLAGSGISGSDNGAGNVARFSGPSNVAVGSNGVVYVTEVTNQAVRQIQPNCTVSLLAGSLSESGSTDATGAAARFNQPSGLAVDSTGRIHVADTNNNLIRRITPAGVVTTIAGTGDPGSADGAGSLPATPLASFNLPRALMLDSSGAVIVLEGSGSRIRRIAPSSVIVQVATGLTGVSEIPVAATINGLVSGTSYYFRAFATNGGGTSYGDILEIGAGGSLFSAWQTEHFGVDAGNSLIAGFDADPSQDGVVNLLKYAFGIDPNLSSQVGLPVPSISDGLLRITYPEVLAATDLAYVPEWSANLVDWSPLGITEEILSTDAGIQQTRASTPISGAPFKYLRLRVTFLQP